MACCAHPGALAVCVAVLGLGLCGSDSARARATVCEDPAGERQLRYSFDGFAEATLDRGAGALKRWNHDGDLVLRAAGGRYTYGAAHRYSIFDFAPERPENNGHLHTFFLPVHRVTRDGNQGWRLSVAPALSASSNVMQHLGDYADDAFQLFAALVGHRKLSDRNTLRYGLCADHRFGAYRVYPTVALRLSMGAAWEAELGFPVTTLSYRFSPRLSSTIGVRPDGNEWYVRNAGLDRSTRIVHESIELGWSLDWRLVDRFELHVGIARQFRHQTDLVAVDGSRTRLASDSFNGVGAGLRWLF